MTDQFDNLKQTQPLIDKGAGAARLNKSVSLDPKISPPKTSLQASNFTSPQRTTSTGGKSSKGPNTEKKKPIREDLSIDQIDELFESFSLFDKDYDGAINREELSVIMKSIGLNVTDLEINEMIDEVDTKDKNNIDFPEFLTFLARKTVDLDSKEQNIKDQIFEIFNNSEKPGINSSDLIRILGELNEPCEREEIEKLLRESSINGDIKNGEIAIGTRELELMLKSDKNKEVKE